MTFNFIVSKIYVDKVNVNEYDDINRLTIHIMQSLILCPLAKTAYLAIVRIVFCQMFRSKSKEVKNDLKLNVLFTLFVQFLVENLFFF